MKRSTLPMVNTQMQAADIIAGKLRSADFSENDTSALFPNKGGTRDFAHKNETKKPEDLGTGGVIGGTIGLFAGMGELALLGSGAFIAAGSVIAGLSVAAMTVGVCGLPGARIGLGLAEDAARSFKEEIPSQGEAQGDVKTQDLSEEASGNGSSPGQGIPASQATTAQETPLKEHVQVRAYFIAERRKTLGVSGDKFTDWVQAEREYQVEGI